MAPARAGLDAGVMRKVVELGLRTGPDEVLHACAMILFAFLFQARSVTVDHVAEGDVEFTDYGGMQARLIYRKGKPTSRPVQLRYPPSPRWVDGTGPPLVLRRWWDSRPGGRGLLNLRTGDKLSTASMGSALKVVLHALGVSAPLGYYYGTHSARIGSFNELSALQFAKVWLIHWMDWATEGMF